MQAYALHEAQREAEWIRRDLMQKAGVNKLTDNELQQIIDLGGIQKILTEIRKQETGGQVLATTTCRVELSKPDQIISESS